MPSPSTLLLFLAAGVVLIAVPGPNLIYIMTRSIAEGRTAGLISGLGVETGTLVHVAAAAIGLSALLASSATAFAVVKYLGAGYLIYLGIRALRQPAHEMPGVGHLPAVSLRLAFRQALVVQLLNPKVALFFLAFMPQFIDPSRGAAWAQILVLGTILSLLGLCINSIYALAAASAGSWLRDRPGVLSKQRYLTGSVYIGLGVAAAATGDNRLATQPS